MENWPGNAVANERAVRRRNMWFQRGLHVVEGETRILSLLMRYWGMVVRDVKGDLATVEDIEERFSDFPKRQALRDQISEELLSADSENLRALELKCFFHACQMGEVDFDMSGAVETFKELRRKDSGHYEDAASYYRERYLELYTFEDVDGGGAKVVTDLCHYYGRFF